MSAHSHHSHAGHEHAVAASASDRRLLIAVALIGTLMGGEVAAGIVAHSLALLSDAGHMLTDAAALGLSLAAARLARRPARGSMTYGWRRVEVLAAQANGMTLLILAVLIVYEAIRRLLSPPHVHPLLVLIVALAGAAINVAAALTLAGANRRSINIEGSFQHIVTDLYAFIGTAIAAAVMLATGFDRADAIVSLLVAALMIRAGVELVSASARMFLEAAPAGLDPQQIGNALASAPEIVEIHDLHVWEVTSGFPALSAHVLVAADGDCHAARRRLAELLAERFSITHSTLQVEHAPAELLEIEQPARAGERTG